MYMPWNLAFNWSIYCVLLCRYCVFTWGGRDHLVCFGTKRKILLNLVWPKKFIIAWLSDGSVLKFSVYRYRGYPNTRGCCPDRTFVEVVDLILNHPFAVVNGVRRTLVVIHGASIIPSLDLMATAVQLFHQINAKSVGLTLTDLMLNVSMLGVHGVL